MGGTCRQTVMRKRVALFLALTVAVTVSQAQRPATAPRMTGERLIVKLTPVDPASITPNPRSVLTATDLAEYRGITNREFVEGYISAVYDATEGRTWCRNEKNRTPKPDTLWDESRFGLHRLPPEQLKRNAAELLVEIWREKWPCPDGERRKK